MKWLLLAALVVISVMAWQMNKSKRESVGEQRKTEARERDYRSSDPMAWQSPVKSDDPRVLKVRDMVEYLNVTYYVREIINYVEGAYRWKELVLGSAGDQIAYLGIEEDGRLILTWWQDEDSPDDLKPEKSITIGGVTYRRDDYGSASYSCAVGQMFGRTGTVKYWDYKRVGGEIDTLVSIERYGEGGKLELNSGMEIHPSQLTCYPTSPVS